MDARDGWFPYIWDPHSLQWILGVVMASILMFVGAFLQAYFSDTMIPTIFIIVMIITWLVLGLVVHSYEKKKRRFLDIFQVPPMRNEKS